MKKRHNKKGFSLLEIILTITILSLVISFTIPIATSMQNMGKQKETINRLNEIAAKLKDYYKAHRNLPDGTSGVPVGATDPVGAAGLSMEQKYRLDAWGQYITYARFTNNSALTINTDGTNSLVTLASGSKTLIRGIQVYGNRFAGILISNGSNQTPDSSNTGTYPVIYTIGKDDIVVPVDLAEEAMGIAIEDLHKLQDKVHAFDAIYSGVDNYSSGAASVDESGCIRQAPATNFPPLSPTNDPNCGTATLDSIYLGDYYTASCTYDGCSILNWSLLINTTLPTSEAIVSTTNNVNAFFYCYYSLSKNEIYDPWLNVYVWDGGITDKTDRRYHKFYSMGPLFTDPNDDIVP